MANFTKALCFGWNLHNYSTYHAITRRVNSFAQKGLSAWQQRQEFSRDVISPWRGRWRKGRRSPDYKTKQNSEVWLCDISGDFKRMKDCQNKWKDGFYSVFFFFLGIVNLFSWENGWLLKDYWPADDDYNFFSNHFKSHTFIVSTPAEKMPIEMKENASG